MIESYKELKEWIIQERKLYGLATIKTYIKEMLLCSCSYKRYRFNYYLRHAEYWKNRKSQSIFSKIVLLYYTRRKNILGIKLGFDVGLNCLGKGFVIFHSGYFVVNPRAKIGENCHVVGNVCIGNKKKGGGAPTIGNNVVIGNGVSIIGEITIPNNTTFAAGTVCNKSIEVESLYDRIIVKGVPGKATFLN